MAHRIVRTFSFPAFPCWTAVLLACICTPASAEIFNCEGKWTNKPCSIDAKAVFEETSARSRPSGDKVESSELKSQTTDSASEKSIRYPKYDRPDPDVVKTRYELFGSQEPFGRRQLEVGARIRSSGNALVDLKLKWKKKNDKLWREQEIGSKTLKFEGRNQEKEVVFKFDLPLSAVEWDWLVTAKYASKTWPGYYDLSGCCSHHEGTTTDRCDSNGSVICADGKQSPTCQCAK